MVEFQSCEMINVFEVFKVFSAWLGCVASTLNATHRKGDLDISAPVLATQASHHVVYHHAHETSKSLPLIVNGHIHFYELWDGKKSNWSYVTEFVL